MLQPEELDSDRTSRVSGDDINTHSSASSMSGSFTNQDWQGATNTSSIPTNDSTIVNTRQTTITTQMKQHVYRVGHLFHMIFHQLILNLKHLLFWMKVMNNDVHHVFNLLNN